VGVFGLGLMGEVIGEGRGKVIGVVSQGVNNVFHAYLQEGFVHGTVNRRFSLLSWGVYFLRYRH
jgi:hypothetical protein